MTRTPLRPLARILDARARGENPELIERENIRQRHERMRDRMRARSESRLLMLAMVFMMGFAVVGLRMGVLASTEAQEPRAGVSVPSIIAQRADIVDRHGNVLATNLVTNSLYAQPPLMVDRARAARELARIFPDLDESALLKDFTGTRKFLWIKRKISPEQQQMVHDIGEPGLLFGPREMRLYPNGRLAAHVLGGAGFGREGVHSAEVIGVAGVEKEFDAYLRDPANGGAPLALSLDLSVQATARRVLEGGMKIMNARGATSILMDARTGEVVSLVSLPDFDPNDRPVPLTRGDAAESPLFNRAVQGVYELGSTFKLFTAAQALDEGLVRPESLIDTRGPLKAGGFTIRDFHYYGPEMSLNEVIVKSSNIGTARVATAIGGERQKAFLEALGFLAPTPVELVEADGAQPLYPRRWSELSTMTISYGHGLSASPLHLAAAYASVLNGGRLVTPTLLRREEPQAPGPRIVSAETSRVLRGMLREVVTRGTATFGDVPGYAVGGKTGTADKPRPQGGYYEDRVIATFASVFPVHDPRYVLVVTLDEPMISAMEEAKRTAGWTAVPVAAEMIHRVAPLLGLRPEIEPGAPDGLMLTAN